MLNQDTYKQKISEMYPAHQQGFDQGENTDR